MSPFRMLSFSPEAFIALFEQYNRALGPAAPVAAYALGLAALVLVLRPVQGGGRWVAAILASMWAWNGIAYHVLFFAEINFIAPVFGAAFVLQALLFAWTAARGRPVFRFRPDPAGRAGLAIAVFAMAVYPLAGWLAGHGWPRAAVFGIAPCPTTMFTLGLLLLAEGRAPWRLLAIPLAWSLVGGSAAWWLKIPEDLVLLLAGLAAFALVYAKNRRAES